MKADSLLAVNLVETVLEYGTVDFWIGVIKVDMEYLVSFLTCFDENVEIVRVRQEAMLDNHDIGRQLVPLDESRVERIVDHDVLVRGCVCKVWPVEVVGTVHLKHTRLHQLSWR
jgi:hypothetical protein